jgi:hypothetical protein
VEPQAEEARDAASQVLAQLERSLQESLEQLKRPFVDSRPARETRSACVPPPADFTDDIGWSICGAEWAQPPTNSERLETRLLRGARSAYVATTGNEIWSPYGAQPAQLVATGRKSDVAETGSDR